MHCEKADEYRCKQSVRAHIQYTTEARNIHREKKSRQKSRQDRQRINACKPTSKTVVFDGFVRFVHSTSELPSQRKEIS